MKMIRVIAVVGCFQMLAFFSHGATHVVQMTNFRFTPQTITIDVGDTITWANVSGSHDVEANDGTFKSPFPISTSFSFTFNTAKTINYRCNPHASFGMVGTIVVQAASAPPTVSITAPSQNEVFAAPANVVVEADANDDQSVTKVDFIFGRSTFTDTTPPYSTTLSNLQPGSYLVQARAFDGDGQSTFSSTVAFTVEAGNAAPTIEWVGPEDGAVFEAPASVTLSAQASDSDGQVSEVAFYRVTDGGGRELLGAAAGTQELTLTDLAEGAYEVVAEATDDDGATAETDEIGFIVYAPFSIESVSRADGVTTILSTVNADLGAVVLETSLDFGGWTVVTPVEVDQFEGMTRIRHSGAAESTAFYRVRLDFPD